MTSRLRRAAPAAAALVALASPIAFLAWEAARHDATWRTGRERHAEEPFATAALVAAGGALVALGGFALARALASPREARAASLRAARSVAIDLAVVLAASLAVRYGLGTANLLTDGASGAGRVVAGNVGYGGMAIVVRLFTEADAPITMRAAIVVCRAFAALAPPLVVALGRNLGLPRVPALLAGLALACLPVHAALYDSDFEMGPLVAIDALGLALVASRADSVLGRAAIAAGACVLSFAPFVRPDAVLVAIPAALLAWRSRDRLRSAIVPAAALGWLAGCLAVAACWTRWALPPREFTFPTVEALPWGEYLTDAILLPPWLWGGAIAGWAARRRAPAGLVRAVAVGALASVPPLFFAGSKLAGSGDTGLEFFRYGSPALPWIAVLAGFGLDALARSLARSSPALVSVGRAAVAAAIVATPLAAREYLGRVYGPFAEEPAFVAALRALPPECRLVVPDDLDDLSQYGGTIEVFDRYAWMAWEASLSGGRELPPDALVPASKFVREGARTDRCTWFFDGAYCHTGIDGVTPPTCDEIRRMPSVVRATFPIEYRSHRLVTRPRVARPPWFDREMRIELRELVPGPRAGN